MERNDIALVRRWAEEIARDEIAALEMKFAKDIEAINEQIQNVKDRLSNNELTISKDFASIKESLTKNPKPRGRKKVEKAIAVKGEIR
jgi:hypothetical protein